MTFMQKSGPEKIRHSGVDALRYGLIFMVVLLHSLPPMNHPETPHWAVFTSFFCRAAVPFFFIASGYFLPAPKASFWQPLLRPLRRLLPVFLFWMAFYFVFLCVFPLQIWVLQPRDLISGGTAFHLWFLPALGIGLALVGMGLRVFGSLATGIFCCLLAAYSLVHGAYHDVLGLSGEVGRGGAYIAPLYVYIGNRLAKMPVQIGLSGALAVIGAAYALLVGEEFFIAQKAGTAILVSHDFVLSTFLLGVGYFLLALALRETEWVKKAARFGAASLGVYASHLVFVWIFVLAIGHQSPGQVFALAITSFIAATLFTELLVRVPYLAKVAK